MGMLRLALRPVSRAPFGAVRTFCASAELVARQKKLIWHSKQRGWLELGLLLGGFAQKNVSVMTPEQLDLFEDVLARETPDLFKYLSAQQPLPDDLAGNEVMQMILKYVNDQHPAQQVA